MVTFSRHLQRAACTRPRTRTGTYICAREAAGRCRGAKCGYLATGCSIFHRAAKHGGRSDWCGHGAGV